MKTALCLFVCFLAACPTADSSDTPTPDDLLTKYRGAVDKLDRVRLEHVEERLLDQPTSQTTEVPPAKFTEKNKRTILRDGAKWHVTNEIVVTSAAEKPPGEASRHIDAVFSDQILIVNNGEHTLWIDRKSGCLPRRIQIRKQLGNLWDDVQIGALAGQSSEPAERTVVAPNGIKSRIRTPDIREFELTVDNIELQEVGGLFVMTKWSVEETTAIGNAKAKRRSTSQNSVRDVEFVKDVEPKSFQLETVVPNGTSVNVMDGAPGARYEWIDGAVKQRGGN